MQLLYCEDIVAPVPPARAKMYCAAPPALLGGTSDKVGPQMTSRTAWIVLRAPQNVARTLPGSVSEMLAKAFVGEAE